MILKKKRSKSALIILDGWGIAPTWGGNAISQAYKPTFDRIWKSYPKTTLVASGEEVGLPANAPGNSETGHLNIGAGHVVHQDIILIDSQIKSGVFAKNSKILGAINHARKNQSKVHLVGLLSKTGIHSHVRHLYALLELMQKEKFNQVYIHLFSDGRDSNPMSGIEMVDELETKLKTLGVGQISTVMGRFYAMDRDNRWGRVARAYNLLVKGEGEIYRSARLAFASSYSRGITDEFIEPRIIVNKTQSKITISNNDSVIFFNFRSDRIKELTSAFLSPKINQFPDRQRLTNLYVVSFAIYDNQESSHQVFSPEVVVNPIAKVWADQGLKQLHIAETEKYPHITYFINGGVEKPYPGEKRVLVPSRRDVKTYDFVPEMSAEKVTKEIVRAIKSNSFDSFIINYANTDMVGHTGNLVATIKAVEYVDKCLNLVLTEFLKRDGIAFVLADHGNAEQMINPHSGEPDTEHTTNPVPFIIVSSNKEISSLSLKNGVLSSVAPTILDVTNITKPPEMTGNSLVQTDEINPAPPIVEENHANL